MDDGYSEEAILPLDEEDMIALGEHLETLPPEHLDWVAQLFLECRRARAGEARLAADAAMAAGGGDDLTQVVLDTTEWLRTLWEVGYMGSSSFPASPCTRFPMVTGEDIAKSALLARIRHGKAPLPFPPPTRNGVPWHEVVESNAPFPVRAEVLRNDGVDWVSIEGCAEWQLVSEEPDGKHFRVQHRYKGPIYHLILHEADAATLQRCPPPMVRRIFRQSRGGLDAYLLEWPKDDGATRRIPLPAASRQRAEEEARRWVAHHHPALYGQILFEHAEA